MDPLLTFPSITEQRGTRRAGSERDTRSTPVIPLPVSPPGGTPELRYQGHAIEVDRHGRAVGQVALALGSRSWRGEATGRADEERRLVLLGRATVEAISAASDEAPARFQSLNLHGVKEITAFGRCFVLVAVHAVRDREAIASAGVSEVEDSREAAAIAATLQATDRWVRGPGRSAGATRSP